MDLYQKEIDLYQQNKKMGIIHGIVPGTDKYGYIKGFDKKKTDEKILFHINNFNEDTKLKPDHIGKKISYTIDKKDNKYIPKDIRFVH